MVRSKLKCLNVVLFVWFMFFFEVCKGLVVFEVIFKLFVYIWKECVEVYFWDCGIVVGGFF